LVIAAILHRDEGGGQVGRHVFQGQSVADQCAAMAEFVAIGIEKGERDGPVGGVEVLAQIELGREPHENRGCEIEQCDRDRDDRDQHAREARESESVADDPVAQRVQIFREVVARHGCAKLSIFAAVSRP